LNLQTVHISGRFDKLLNHCGFQTYHKTYIICRYWRFANCRYISPFVVVNLVLVLLWFDSVSWSSLLKHAPSHFEVLLDLVRACSGAAAET